MPKNTADKSEEKETEKGVTEEKKWGGKVWQK
jgi:hypothetical protein